ncbi:transcriptional repressor TCF25-domain-containing protein [Cubamyces lactineus]|nr:transcriptional repressor TCF25-domain-containing protein [Cubamyces lactineus]
MPPRLNKRQLREQEELQALKTDVKQNDGDSEGQSETSSPIAPPKPVVGGFAALMADHDDDDSEEDEAAQTKSSKSKKKKKKKKSSAATPAAAPSPAPESHTPEPAPAPAAETPQPPASSSGPSKKERKALKKQKAKGKQKDDMDDVDKALAELSLKYPDLKQQLATAAASTSSPAAARSLAALLAVSLQHLDSEAELRKFFGSKVVAAAKSGAPSGPARPSVMQRSNLTRPKPTWWPAQLREGLSVRPLTADELDAGLRRHGWQPLHGEKLWTIEYSKKYRAVTLQFMRTVMSGDPEGFYQLLRLLPYHADTLLQLSEVYHHREEHSTAADFVDRALFTYERGFVGAFNFTSGANRLDFDHVENRPFFLALHRQVTDLQRRGCVRTAFEFARLMYALDPWSDPHGALLHLDYLSIKAGMTQWLIDLCEVFESDVEKEVQEGKSPYVRRIIPNIMPGIAYSHALALFMREESSGDSQHERSTAALKHAVLNHPPVVPILADKADISLSGDIRSHPAFRIHPDASMLLSDSHAIFHLLSHLYAQRAAALWKPAARASWFAQTVASVYNTLPTVPPAPPKLFFNRFENPALAWSIYRHVLVNESTCRSLFPFVPRQLLDARHLACDPLPPSTRVSEYDSEFFHGVEDMLAARPRSRRQEARFLERLVPDGPLRRQLQDLWDAHPGLAQRFPGGIIQFAQVAAEMPDMFEDMMVALADAGADGVPELREGGVMPGGMPGGEVMVNFVDPEDDIDDVEDLPLQPVAPTGQQNAGAQQQEDEDGEEDEDEEEEEVAPLPVRFVRSLVNRFWGGRSAAENDEDSDEEGQLRDTEGVD